MHSIYTNVRCTISNLISFVQKVCGVATRCGDKLKTHVVLMSFSNGVWKVLKTLSNKALDVRILGLKPHTPLMSQRTKPTYM